MGKEFTGLFGAGKRCWRTGSDEEKGADVAAKSANREWKRKRRVDEWNGGKSVLWEKRHKM